jgi:hypothetical protein
LSILRQLIEIAKATPKYAEERLRKRLHEIEDTLTRLNEQRRAAKTHDKKPSA